MATLKLEIVTPTGAVLDIQADAVSVPGVEGELGVLPDHRPALVMLSGGAVRYAGAKGEGLVYIRGGLAEIAPDRVLVLADEARMPGEENRSEAESLLRGVETALATHTYLDAEALARVEVDRGYAEVQLGVRR